MAEDTENNETKPVHAGTANLKPFPPGVSGNPKGRPKGSMNRKSLFLKYLELAAFADIAKVQKAQSGVDLPAESVGEQIAGIVVAKALGGDMEAINMVLDNALEKMAEKSEVKGDLGIKDILDAMGKKKRDLPRKKQGNEECNQLTQNSTPSTPTTLPPTLPLPVI